MRSGALLDVLVHLYLVWCLSSLYLRAQVCVCVKFARLVCNSMLSLLQNLKSRASEDSRTAPGAHRRMVRGGGQGNYSSGTLLYNFHSVTTHACVNYI